MSTSSNVQYRNTGIMMKEQAGQMKIVLGLDSGLANCGYGVVARSSSGFVCLAHGNIRTKADSPRPDRLLKIYQHAAELITEWNPSKISIESIYWNRNQKSCLPTAEVIGVLQLAAVQKNVEVMMFSPQSVKSAVTGIPDASKTQVMRMTQKLLGMKKPVTPSHAADALGCAIAALICRNTALLEHKHDSPEIPDNRIKKNTSLIHRTGAKSGKPSYQTNERP